MGLKCSVIIPTKNAMPGFVAVLEKVRAQSAPWPFDVIVIDSGSKDGTVEHVRRFADVRLIQIPPEAFGHGRTRNQAIAASEAEFAALLTHDAEPLDDAWLRNLVAAAEQDARIAGVFGRHVAQPTASPFVKQDLERHFDWCAAHPLVVDTAQDPDRYAADEGWRQLLHFYSDNNSLMRRSVWKDLPYPDVEFAEDQLWAQAAIEAGHAKAYAPDAVVIHSHDYAPVEQLRRAFDESRNFRKYFGYRLSGRPSEALAGMARALGEAFRQDVDEDRYGRTAFPTRLRRGLQRAALVAGHFLGSNHERLPAAAARRLSLDQRLFDA